MNSTDFEFVNQKLHFKNDEKCDLLCANLNGFSGNGIFMGENLVFGMIFERK